MLSNVAELARQMSGPAWLIAQREALAQQVADEGLPTAAVEAWRYSPISEVSLEQLLARADADSEASAQADTPDALMSGGALLAGQTHNGAPTGSAGDLPSGVTVTRLSELSEDDGVDAQGPVVDTMAGLSRSLSPDTIVIDVAPGTVHEAPLVVLHHIDDSASAHPGLVVRHGADSEVSVVEHRSAGPASLILPHTRIVVGDAARARHQVVQLLGTGAWQMGTLSADVGAQATLRMGVGGFGGRYARLRTDCRLGGRGASVELVAVSQTIEDETVDFRCFIDHDAPDTSSDLLFVGTLDDRSSSIYSGMLRIAEGAVRSDAHQTNRNLKLSEDAWAESVPNLEILNNDVHCSHASSMGPVDPDHAFYLASRGVPPEQAERLLVRGFLDQAIQRMPSARAAELFTSGVEDRLDVRTAHLASEGQGTT